jgi:hypothetical protein
MKTVSEDKSYIDCTYGDFGVRVWKESPSDQADADASGWLGEENILPVPVPDSILGFPNRIMRARQACMKHQLAEEPSQ